MNKSPIPSRNKKVIHSNYFICCHCKTTLYYDMFTEDDIFKFSENTTIYTCPICNTEQVANVQIEIDYVFSGHCKTKDKTKIKSKNN